MVFVRWNYLHKKKDNFVEMVAAVEKEFSQGFRMKGVFEELLKINVPERPPWRSNNAGFPTVSVMLADLSGWLDGNVESTIRHKLQKLKLDFVFYTNLGEKEGTQTYEATEAALNKKDDAVLSYEEQVSKNLLDTLNFLDLRSSVKDKGLLDVEECVQDAHKILMKKLLISSKCGQFSTFERITTDGHRYPKFESEEEVYNAMLIVVDKYNSTMDYVKKSSLNSKQQMAMLFRCAAWILYNFVSLHPFSDGNGRMGRLLACYCLYSRFPFPCPLYNIFAPNVGDFYLDALRMAQRHNGEKLDYLVALLIESAWHTFQKLRESN